MKKKIFAAILAAAMVMSLTACGKDTKVTSSVEEVVEEAVASVEEAAEEVVEEAVEEVAAEETAEETEDVDITGTIDGNVYTNEFFGFKVEAAEGYTFTDENLTGTLEELANEKIAETDTALGKLASQKVKEGGQVVDFYLADSTFLNTLNLTMSYLGSSSITQESMESIMSIMLPSLKETYEQMGFSDLTCEMSTTTVMGKDTPCIVLQGKGESEGITFDMYINQAFMVKDGYMACFTAGTALEDHRDDLLAMITSLE